MRLRRLAQVWIDHPLYFITTCLKNRRRLLADRRTAGILVREWKLTGESYGWHVGSYVIMPDHVHFFCSNDLEAKPLSTFVGKWKERTSKKVGTKFPHRSMKWQRGFFDHVLRSSESYSEKWDYVRNNPVRADLVESPEDWPYWGVIDDLSFG